MGDVIVAVENDYTAMTSWPNVANDTEANLSAIIEEDFPSDPAAVIVPIVFALIFIVGIAGNGVLILTVLLNAPLRTKPNILIVSLALGDFLLILVSVPFTSIIYTVSGWWFGAGLCKLNEFMQTLSLGVSTVPLLTYTLCYAGYLAFST